MEQNNSIAHVPVVCHDHANELRRMARKIGHPAGDVPAVMRAAAAHIEHLERQLREAEARVAVLESELRDDHWPNGATVKLRWAGKHGWAKRDAEGHLISVCSGIRLNDTAWEVVQERKPGVEDVPNRRTEKARGRR